MRLVQITDTHISHLGRSPTENAVRIVVRPRVALDAMGVTL
jgi:hypothetical protein